MEVTNEYDIIGKLEQEIVQLQQERDSARARLEKFAGMLTAKDADLADLTEERDRLAAVNRQLVSAAQNAIVRLRFGQEIADEAARLDLEEAIAKSALAGLEDGK